MDGVRLSCSILSHEFHRLHIRTGFEILWVGGHAFEKKKKVYPLPNAPDPGR